jgi:hypothetical protein
MGVSLKTEQRRSHSAVSSFRPRVRRAEGYWGTCQRKLCMEVPVKPRRPPSLPLICGVLPDHSSFSVLRETPMAFSCNNFKKLTCYRHCSLSRECRVKPMPQPASPCPLVLPRRKRVGLPAHRRGSPAPGQRESPLAPPRDQIS